MTKLPGVKLYILPAHKAPALWLPEEPRRPLKKIRIYDANGTEFVGIDEVMCSSDPESPLDTIVTIRMRLSPGESAVLDAPFEDLPQP